MFVYYKVNFDFIKILSFNGNPDCNVLTKHNRKKIGALGSRIYKCNEFPEKKKKVSMRAKIQNWHTLQITFNENPNYSIP